MNAPVPDTMIEEVALLRPQAETVLTEVLEERYRQDCRWGGPEHDDAHAAVSWLDFVEQQLCKAADAGDTAPPPAQDTIVRHRLVKIAALAVAGIQSIDRLTGKAQP